MSALVLVADADPFNLRLLSELCATLGYDVMTAADGGSVLDAVARQRPALVLMGAELPVMDGFQVLRILKADAGLQQVPVLLVTEADDTAGRERGFELGAIDCMTKPYRTLEIQQRLRNVLKLTRVRDTGPGSDRPEGETELPHTGTRSQLHLSLDYEFTRAVRYKHPLSCVVVHCANYAALSTALGAIEATERVAVPLAAALRSGIRNVDHLFRASGAEFVILLPETAAAGARIVVDRLRALLADPALFDSGGATKPELAVGAASYPKTKARDGEQLWRAAERALQG
jgi:two-component system, cell cycle response regulator